MPESTSALLGCNIQSLPTDRVDPVISSGSRASLTESDQSQLQSDPDPAGESSQDSAAIPAEQKLTLNGDVHLENENVSSTNSQDTERSSPAPSNVPSTAVDSLRTESHPESLSHGSEAPTSGSPSPQVNDVKPADASTDKDSSDDEDEEQDDEAEESSDDAGSGSDVDFDERRRRNIQANLDFLQQHGLQQAKADLKSVGKNSKSANAKTYGGRKRTATENKADDDRDDPNENQRELRRSTRIVAKATANDIKPQRKKQLKPVKLQLSEHYSIDLPATSPPALQLDPQASPGARLFEDLETDLSAVRETRESDILTASEAAAEEESPQSQIQYKFQCPMCDRKFKTRKSFNNHRKVHHADVKNGDLDSIKPVAIKPEPVELRCGLCDKTFYKQTKFDAHLKKCSSKETYVGKSRQKSYKCTADEHCTFVCSSRFQAVRHVLNKHVSVERVPFGCSLCGWRFLNVESRRNHRDWRYHKEALKRAADRGDCTNEDSYDYRSMNPVTPEQLEEMVERCEGTANAQLVKVGQILYRCVGDQSCDYSSDHRSNVITHALLRHVSPDRVPFRCTLCGKNGMFRKLVSLRSHRNWVVHKTAVSRAIAQGKTVKEDSCEVHSADPVDCDSLVERVTLDNEQPADTATDEHHPADSTALQNGTLESGQDGSHPTPGSKPAKKKKFRCKADPGCDFLAGTKTAAVTHALLEHVDRERVPYGCDLCGYRCYIGSQLKWHRTGYPPHKAAMQRAAKRREWVNENALEYQGSDPAPVDSLVEAVEANNVANKVERNGVVNPEDHTYAMQEPSAEAKSNDVSQVNGSASRVSQSESANGLVNGGADVTGEANGDVGAKGVKRKAGPLSPSTKWMKVQERPPVDNSSSDSVVSGRATCVFRCAADAKCTFEAKRRRFVVAHVLKVHVAEERVPHHCALCSFRCESAERLAAHRTHAQHRAALKAAQDAGRDVDEDAAELHSDNPVNVDQLVVAGAICEVTSKAAPATAESPAVPSALGVPLVGCVSSPPDSRHSGKQFLDGSDSELSNDASNMSFGSSHNLSFRDVIAQANSAALPLRNVTPRAAQDARHADGKPEPRSTAGKTDKTKTETLFFCAEGLQDLADLAQGRRREVAEASAGTAADSERCAPRPTDDSFGFGEVERLGALQDQQQRRERDLVQQWQGQQVFSRQPLVAGDRVPQTPEQPNRSSSQSGTRRRLFAESKYAASRPRAPRFGAPATFTPPTFMSPWMTRLLQPPLKSTTWSDATLSPGSGSAFRDMRSRRDSDVEETPVVTTSFADSDMSLDEDEVSRYRLSHFSKVELWEELKTRDDFYKCSCPMAYRELPLFLAHTACHRSDNPYTCAICRLRATNWSTFYRHFINH